MKKKQLCPENLGKFMTGKTPFLAVKPDTSILHLDTQRQQDLSKLFLIISLALLISLMLIY
jgi:hypothetical protein